MIGADGRTATRAVKVGACDEERCEVTGGLAPGESRHRADPGRAEGGRPRPRGRRVSGA